MVLLKVLKKRTSVVIGAYKNNLKFFLCIFNIHIKLLQQRGKLPAGWAPASGKVQGEQTLPTQSRQFALRCQQRFAHMLLTTELTPASVFIVLDAGDQSVSFVNLGSEKYSLLQGSSCFLHDVTSEFVRQGDPLFAGTHSSHLDRKQLRRQLFPLHCQRYRRGGDQLWR